MDDNKGVRVDQAMLAKLRAEGVKITDEDISKGMVVMITVSEALKGVIAAVAEGCDEDRRRVAIAAFHTLTQMLAMGQCSADELHKVIDMQYARIARNNGEMQ